MNNSKYKRLLRDFNPKLTHQHSNHNHYTKESVVSERHQGAFGSFQLCLPRIDVVIVIEGIKYKIQKKILEWTIGLITVPCVLCGIVI